MSCAAAALTVVLVLSSAAPPAAPAKRKVLVMDIAAAGLDASTIENISGLVAVIVAEDARLDVLSGADVKQLATLAGERAELGCDTTSCLAEIAGAMGAGLIVYGNGGQLGALLNLNLNLFDAARGMSVGRVAIQARGLEELPEKLRPAVRQLVLSGIGPPPSGAGASSGAPSSTGSLLPWALVGGGAVAVVGGVVLGAVGAAPALQIGDAERRFRENPADTAALSEATALHNDWYVSGLAPGALAIGIGLAVVGVAGVGGGVLWATGGAE